jgi:hypothetical protein
MAMAQVALFPTTDDVGRPEGVRTTWLTIDPHVATKHLDAFETFCDAHPELCMNRRVNQSHVAKLATDMKNGHWARNHQGLAFDKNGILIDGQHRLWAVIESGTTQTFLVTTGLDRGAQLTIDLGKGRSTVDVAVIAGMTDVRTLHVGIIKALLRGSASTPPVLTRVEEVAKLSEHQQALEFTMSMFPSNRMVGIMRASVLGVIARAFYTADHDKIRRFVEVLKTGQRGGDETEAVIVALRNYLLLNKGIGSNVSLEVYIKTARALQAYLKGERIRTLYASKGREEPFPLPHLKKTKG